MAEYAKLNDVAAADIVKINGVAYGSVAKCSGLSSPSSGASRWVVVSKTGFLVHALNSNRSSWTSFDNTNDAPHQVDVGFGKNSSGQGIYVVASGGTDREIMVSGTDVTSGTFTDINLSPNDNMYAVRWAAKSDGATAGVWMAGGEDGRVVRSTDGASTWSSINFQGTNLGSKHINGIASNGSGKWMFAAKNGFLYVSTDDGATFTESQPWSTNTPGDIKGIVYTNNSWVVAYRRSSIVRFRSCADSDTSDWGDEFTVNSTNFPARSSNGSGASVTFKDPNGDLLFVRMAAAGGKVCAISSGDEVILSFNVNGKTLSGGAFRDGNKSDETGLDTDGGDLFLDIATDGNGIWVASCEGGDIHASSDNGDTWTKVLDNHTDAGVQGNLNAVCADVILPL